MAPKAGNDAGHREGGAADRVSSDARRGASSGTVAETILMAGAFAPAETPFLEIVRRLTESEIAAEDVPVSTEEATCFEALVVPTEMDAEAMLQIQAALSSIESQRAEAQPGAVEAPVPAIAQATQTAGPQAEAPPSPAETSPLMSTVQGLPPAQAGDTEVVAPQTQSGASAPGSQAPLAMAAPASAPQPGKTRQNEMSEAVLAQGMQPTERPAVNGPAAQPAPQVTQSGEESSLAGSARLSVQDNAGTGLRAAARQQTSSSWQSFQPADTGGELSQAAGEFRAGNETLQAASAGPAAGRPVADAQSDPASQVIESITLQSLSSGRRVVVQLNPPELGAVRLTLLGSGREVRGVLEADDARTLAELQNASPPMIDRLAEAGVQVRRLEFVLSPDAPQASADSSARDNAAAQQQAGDRDSGGREPGSGEDGPAGDTTAADMTAAPNATVSDDAINVWM